MPSKYLVPLIAAAASLGSPAAMAEDAPPAPMVIEAERMQGHQDREIEAHGAVELHKGDQAIYADQAVYSQSENKVTAIGNVLLEQRGDVLAGPKLEMQVETEQGYMETPSYRLRENAGHGTARRLLFEGQGMYRAQQATYTSCATDDEWQMRVGELTVDYGRDVGVARNASIFFKGVPVLYSPWLDFPLHDRRKSGFLTPSWGTTGNSGAEVTLPFYWNIAPNRDATISPRFLAKRGLMLGTHVRYLEQNWRGEAQVDALQNDRVKNRSRYNLSLQHSQSLPGGWNGSLNLQRVSDDAYFTDLSDRIATTSQVNLPRDAALTYGAGWWSFSARVQRFQTLQDPLAPVTPPYHRTPQLLLGAARPNLFGVDAALSGEFVDFNHPTLVNGKRLTLYPALSRPLQTAFITVTPKLGVHLTRYVLNRSNTALPDVTRSVPIFSLDGQVTFERDAELRGTRFVQTLEPRLYYVYAPYRNQDSIPNFDSALADLNFPQIFSENQFSGGDRINDANRVTAGITSRLLEPETGNERLRFTVAQRYYLRTQAVTLNAQPSTDTRSDILSALSGKVTAAWILDAGWQYNPRQNRSEQLSSGLRYQPEIGKVLNLGYRYTRDTLRQADISTQWPLHGRWSGLARWNYSLRDSRILEALGGLEYNASCWSLRLVAHRFASATQEAVNSVFVQLELSGLSRIGANPLEVLRQNIAGYAQISAGH